MMNIKEHKVLSDIKGMSGLNILEAIIIGEHRPDILADLVHHRVKATRDEIIKSLEGNWNDAQLLIMTQNIDVYCFAIKQVEELDLSIELSLTEYSQVAGKSKPEKPIIRALKRPQPLGNAFHFDAERYSYDIPGVNLTGIPGISSLTGIKLISDWAETLQRSFLRSNIFFLVESYPQQPDIWW